ncbi:MAG: acetyl-CoA carboxylase, carboxyltransferase subunit beta [Oscillospiraceae bacterium]
MNPFEERRHFLDVLKKLNKNSTKIEPVTVPDELFVKCSECGQTLQKAEIIKLYNVCPSCGYHYPISAYRRLEMLVDSGSLKELNKHYTVKNPLNFPEYEEKLIKLREKNHLNESVVTAYATIDGIKTVLCVMDVRFLMGSMGAACGEKITRAVEYATKRKLPIIIFCASGGARMQEGILSLFQMAKTSAAIKKHSDAGLLYLSVLTNPTTGGVTASFASLGDIIIAEPNALIGFAGPRVIENTIGEKLPKEAQKSEYMQNHGFVDMIVQRGNMKDIISKILRLHNKKGDNFDGKIFSAGARRIDRI